ncbi:MAG TPA: hypothetical protein VFE37_26220 [Chloroflexota bacterium]|nr:hypothetical protein [Chloroflexota bacterium]
MAESSAGNVWQEIAGGLRRLLGGAWPESERPIAALLDLLVRGSKLKDDLRAVALDAPAVSVREPGDEEARLVREELEAARENLPTFERALTDAWRRSGGTQREVRYDSADPEQDRAAGVLIEYLVTTRMATVRTEERGERAGQPQYWYHIAVNWEALFTVAAHLKVDLRGALNQAA